MNNSHNKLNVGYYVLVHYGFIELSFSVTGEKISLRAPNGLYHISGTFVKNKLQLPTLTLTRKKKSENPINFLCKSKFYIVGCRIDPLSKHLTYTSNPMSPKQVTTN